MSKELEIAKLKLAIKKADTAKDELDVKILEAMDNIQRMEDHKNLQDERMAECRDQLDKLSE